MELRMRGVALRARLDLDSEIPDGALQGKELALEAIELRQDLLITQRMCLRRLLRRVAVVGATGSNVVLCHNRGGQQCQCHLIWGKDFMVGRRRGHQVRRHLIHVVAVVGARGSPAAAFPHRGGQRTGAEKVASE